MSNLDEHWMHAALQLAAKGQGLVEPNPMVGCVLVRDGMMIGEGFHPAFGGPHAEVVALGNATDARGATAYVTLEPCCHFGKTPPCVDALIQAGVKKVVVAMTDPFQQVDGEGIRRLVAAGIEVATGVLQSDAMELNAPYLKRLRTGMPWVIAKWAMSMDGRIATATRQSQWITGEAARSEVHQLRGRVDAIAVGMGTVTSDDPMLTARPPGHRDPLRVVFCRHRLPDVRCRLVQTASQYPTCIVAGPHVPSAGLAQLADHNVECWQCEQSDPSAMIVEALVWLGGGHNVTRRPLTNFVVEGGGELLGSFSAADQIDECHVYIGAKTIGGQLAPGPIGDPGAIDMESASTWSPARFDRFGDDFRLIYRRRGR